MPFLAFLEAKKAKIGPVGLCGGLFWFSRREEPGNSLTTAVGLWGGLFWFSRREEPGNSLTTAVGLWGGLFWFSRREEPGNSLTTGVRASRFCELKTPGRGRAGLAGQLEREKYPGSLTTELPE